MPKSCLWAFPHSERKPQNNPFQIRNFHFHPFFSSLCLRFTVSYLPTFFPKQFYLYKVLNKNSVNRWWVAMALSHRKRPMQFVSSYSFEKVAVLGRIILLLPPGLHSWHALRLRSGCSGPPGYTMLEPSSTRQNPAAQGRTQQQQQKQQQAEPRSSRQNLGAAGRTQKHKAESSTSRQDPPQAGKTSTSVQNPEPSSSRQQQAAVGSSRHQQAEHSNSRQNPAAARRTQRKRAEPSTSRQIPAGTDSAGDGTIQNQNMISFNGHASHRTIDNGTTIKIAINTIQG